MKKTKEAVYWSIQEDDDNLCESDIDQVVMEYLDEYPREEWDRELVVYGFAPSEPHIKDGFSLDRLAEALYEDFGNPNEYGDVTITEAMKEAEKVFHDVVLKEFDVWRCDLVEKRTINIEQWCKENDYEEE
jgi:hypothetical protein